MADPVCSVVEAVRTDLLRRSKAGIAKYGTTLDRTDLSLRDWLQHAYEETLDNANYLKRAILALDASDKPDRAWNAPGGLSEAAVQASGVNVPGNGQPPS